MPSNFPNSADAFTTKTPHVSVNAAADVNNLQDAVLALETALLSAPNPNTLDYMSKSRPDTVTGVKSFSAAPLLNAGATLKQLIFLGPPSGGDDTAIINAAISVAKNYVVLSGGSYSISASLTPAQGVTLEGLGFSTDLNNINDPQWAPATEIKWNNASGAPMIVPATNVSGVQIRNLGLDGNAQATKGIYADRLTASVIENVGVRNLLRGTVGSGIALHLIATNNAIANQNAQHNRVVGFFAFCDEIIRLEGSNPGAVGASNCCHTLFERIEGVFGNVTTNSAGVTMIDADNNTAVDWFLFRSAGTGYGVDLQGAARNNYFYHLQASSGGVHVAAPLSADFSNLIVGYDRGNGQPLPTIDAGGLLDWTETGHLSSGWRVAGFAASAWLGVGAAVPSNAGGLVWHVKQDGATVIPEVRIEGTAASSFADWNQYALTAASVVMRARALLSGPGAVFDFGTVTAHDVRLKANNQVRLQLLNGGGAQFMDAAGTTIEAVLDATGKFTTYNALATAGMGLAAVLVAPAPTLGLTSNAANLASLTSPNDGVKHFYYVTCFARIGTLGSASFGLQVTYTDIGGTARTCTIPVCAEAGAFAAVCNTADDYKGSVMIGVNPNTLITVRTDPAGTYTGVTYAAGGTITQIR